MRLHQKGYPIAAFDDHLDDLGNDLASLLNQDRVANADAPFLDKGFVMQRRPSHRRARDENRGQFRDRRQFSSPSHLHGNGEQVGLFLLGRVFVGGGPTRSPAREAELLLRIAVDHLDDRSIRAVGQRVPLLVETSHRCEHVLEGLGGPERLVFPDSDPIEEGVKVGDRADLPALDDTDPVGDEIERTRRHLAWVEQLQGPGGGVAGIGEGRESSLIALLVHLRKGFARHEDLATDLQDRRSPGRFG